MNVFNTDAIKELIQFKWSEFGQSHHMIGLFFHICQMIMLMIYIQYVYIDDYFDIYKPGGEPRNASSPNTRPPLAHEIEIETLYAVLILRLLLGRNTSCGND